MPITPYTRPQSTITQLLRATEPRVTNRRNTIVIGPQYKLVINDGRELPKYEFKSAGESLKYQELVNGEATPLDPTFLTPVPSSVVLYGEALEALVADEVVAFQRVAGTTNALRLTTGNLAGGTVAGLNPVLDERTVSIGDVFRTTANYSSGDPYIVRRKVTALLPTTTPSVIGDLRKGTTNSAPSAPFTVIASGTYTGKLPRAFLLDCVTEGADVTLSRFNFIDTAGVHPPKVITLSATAQLLADGVSVALGVDAPVVVGDKFYFDLTPAVVVPGEYNGVVLDGPVHNPDKTFVSLSADIIQEYSGPITDVMSDAPPAVVADVDSIDYDAALFLPTSMTRLASRTALFEDGKGHVVPSFKALVKPGLTEPPIYVDSAADCEAKLGEISSTENDLGRGAYEALTGTQFERVYALRTGGETVADFALALRKIQTTDIFYALAVMSNDPEVSALVADHCTLMSDKFHKNFRRCYTGVDSPGQYLKWGNLDSGGLRRATLVGSTTGGLVSVDDEYRAYSNFLEDASVGDFIRFVGLPDYRIKSIMSNGYEVMVDAPEGVLISTPSGFSLIRADTSENTVKFLQDAAAALTNRRAVIVWCDNGTDGQQPIPNRFIAAQIAGLRTALMPQQSLTLTEVSTITDAPSMYTRFTPEQLDEIAAAGVMIVTQESDGGEIFIRHQLTTEVEEGALAYEDNVGVIVDAFSYMVKDEFRDDIGKTNVTTEKREDIEVRYKQLAMNAAKSTLAAPTIGPLIVTFFNEEGTEGEVTVRQDADLADTFITYISLRVPSPLNGLHHYIDVEVATGV